MVALINTHRLKQAIKKEDVAKLKSVIQQVWDHQLSHEFRHPVNWRELGLEDYPQIIKKPMDLSTVKRNLSKSAYKTYEDFFNDIQLIWDNCKTYNMAESEIYKYAEELEKKYKSVKAKTIQSLGLQPQKEGNSTPKKKKA